MRLNTLDNICGDKRLCDIEMIVSNPCVILTFAQMNEISVRKFLFENNCLCRVSTISKSLYRFVTVVCCLSGPLIILQPIESYV